MGVFKPNLGARGRRGACLCLALLLNLTAVVAPLSEAAAKSSSFKAAIVVDVNSGSVLYSQSADALRSPASLTKIMTLYILFGYLRAGKLTYETELVVTPHAAAQAPTKLGLKSGSTIRTVDAINALITKSANDAAAAIAENVGGTEENFARVMTQTARSLGMRSTTFRNASGLPNDEQLTTARDMAILAMHLIRDYPEYYKFFETRYFTYKGAKHRNHNRLLFGYRGTDGIKTGYTQASGFNLTASVQRDGKHLVGVVLGGRTGSQRDAAMRSLLDKQWSKASKGQSPSRSLVASLLGTSSPPPPSRKPAFALAGAAPAMGLAEPSEEGDAEDPAETVQASLAPSAAPSRGGGSAKKVRYAGNYHVQVGSFTSQSDAENRLGKVQQRAPDLLDGHLPFTAAFMRGDTEWYRARFAGFSQGDAQTTCKALKRMSLECIAMPAE
ncbi:MAG: D-alanyl-D-alanine carboxypeptidase [Methyloceanibacter sp.]